MCMCVCVQMCASMFGLSCCVAGLFKHVRACAYGSMLNAGEVCKEVNEQWSHTHTQWQQERPQDLLLGA